MRCITSCFIRNFLHPIFRKEKETHKHEIEKKANVSIYDYVHFFGKTFTHTIHHSRRTWLHVTDSHIRQKL